MAEEFKYESGEVLCINMENKVLPFVNFKNFRNVMIKHYKNQYKKDETGNLILDEKGNKIIEHGFLQTFEKAINEPSIKAIVIESFSRLSDLLQIHTDRVEKKTGYDFWGYYKDEISRIMLQLSANCPKPIIWTALPETIFDDNNRKTERIAVDGSHKGKIESYFEIVLYSTINEKAKELKDRHVFSIRSDGKSPAKVPFELYPEETSVIPNDVNAVLNQYRKVWGVDPKDNSHHYPNIIIVGASGMGKSTSLRNLVKNKEKGESDATKKA